MERRLLGTVFLHEDVRGTVTVDVEISRHTGRTFALR
jgi:hypothetical protein